MNKLEFKKVIENKNLIAESTYNCIEKTFSEVEKIICGSGLQKSKLSLPSKYLLKLKNVEILENLAKE